MPVVLIGLPVAPRSGVGGSSARQVLSGASPRAIPDGHGTFRAKSLLSRAWRMAQ